MFFLLCLLTIYIVILNKHFVEKFPNGIPKLCPKTFPTYCLQHRYLESVNSKRFLLVLVIGCADNRQEDHV